MTVLVTGATGKVGGALLPLLGGAGIRTRALVRSPERADDLRGLDVEVAIGAFDRPESLDDALRGVDSALLVCPLNEQQGAWETAFVDACGRATTAPHVVKIAAIGYEQRAIRLGAVHAEIVDALVAAGVPHTVLAPNGFFQNLLMSAASISHGVLASPLTDASVSYVDVRDVAAVAAHVLADPGLHQGASYPITGPAALTQAEVVATMTRVLRREVRHQSVSLDEWRAGALAHGMAAYDVDALAELQTLYATGAAAGVTDEVTKATGHPARGIDDFVADHRAAFLSG